MPGGATCLQRFPIGGSARSAADHRMIDGQQASLLAIVCYTPLIRGWQEIFAEVNDRVQIVCPYSSVLPVHQSIIYRVSQDDFFDCRLGPSAKEAGRCVSPREASSLSLAFRSFSPNPFALEYHPDRTYYFISTSDGSSEGLDRKVGGLCESDGMKMMVHIAEKAEASWVRQWADPLPLLPLDKMEPESPLQRSLYELDHLGNELVDRVEFQIHEIGDAEAFSSSARSRLCSAIIAAVFLLCFF
ncbi:unnamed protein product, partial [Mesorhabditis spiculigera]